MLARNQAYSRMFHALLSAYGSRWANLDLLMFTFFIDDSGTAPEHRMAIAAGIIIPSLRLLPFESEWKAFCDKEGMEDFHASECLARNKHSAFADWSDDRVRKAFARVRQITLKYSAKSYCVALKKQDYEEIVTPKLKQSLGESYFSWAVSSLVGLCFDWSKQRSVEMEYVFDNSDKAIQIEIEDALAFSEQTNGNRFSGHYSFRSRKEIPALQATDLLAWTCYQHALWSRFRFPIHRLAKESAIDYVNAKGREWLTIQSLHRQGVADLMEVLNSYSQRTEEVIEFRRKRREDRNARSRPRRAKLD
jgi:hypothetical protein